MGEQSVILKKHTDVAFIGRNFADIAPVDQNRAAGRTGETRNHAQSCRLSAAAAAQKGDHFPVLNRKRYLVYRSKIAEFFSQIGDDQFRHSTTLSFSALITKAPGYRSLNMIFSPTNFSAVSVIASDRRIRIVEIAASVGSNENSM